MRSIVVSAVLLLIAASPVWGAGGDCGKCHAVRLDGVHAELSCGACHGSAEATLAQPSSARTGALGCVGCHQGYGQIFDQAMGHRHAEKAFVAQSFGRLDPGFFDKSCASCHLDDCLDCHGGNGHAIAPAASEACLSCHKGYFVGREFLGMAPREDHRRYLRGPRYQGERYLKMRPDVHAEIGMECADCHSMRSLAAGQMSSKSCTDCHQPSLQVIEHRIGAHLQKLECYACHSAWAPQEYGTFYLRAGDEPVRKHFRVQGENGAEYLKSAYLKKQDLPALGLNAKGRISPIRPQFIAYYSDLRSDGGGEQNRLLAAQWKAFFPHTIRRGTPLCDGCHGEPRRFLLETPEQRIYRVDEDGLSLGSFWSQTGQEMVNGEFMPAERFSRMSEKSPAYTKAYVEKWKNLVDRVEGLSKD